MCCAFLSTDRTETAFRCIRPTQSQPRPRRHKRPGDDVLVKGDLLVKSSIAPCWACFNSDIRARGQCSSVLQPLDRTVVCRKNGHDRDARLATCASIIAATCTSTWHAGGDAFRSNSVQPVARGHSDTVDLTPQLTKVAELHAGNTKRVAFNPKQDVEP